MRNLTIETPRNRNGSEASYSVEASHFGINFVANYERIGDLPWERYDEIADHLQPGTLRYPGGSFAEEGFDITKPNETEITSPDGSTHKTMGAYDFAQYAYNKGFHTTFIIPTKQLLISAPDNSGKLIFDASKSYYIKSFVEKVLEASNGTVATFEIGNEYETYMDNIEYGQLLNELAPIIQSAIDSYKESHGLGPNWIEPKIAAQVWSWIAQDHSTMTTDNLVTRVNTEIDQLSNVALDAIDALTTHVYIKDRFGGYRSTYDKIEGVIENSNKVLTEWEKRTSTELDLIVSEWAAHFKEQSFWGLAQVPIGVKMFAEFVQTGINELNFWSAQYHGISLALPNGELTPMGVVSKHLKENILGHKAFDLNTESDDVRGVAFLDDAGGTIFLSNLSSSNVDYNFLLNLFSETYKITAVGFVGVDVTGADGKYRSTSGLEIYNEPDLAGKITWSQQVAGTTSVELSAFETVILEVTNAPENSGNKDEKTQLGSVGADHFEFKGDSTGNIVEGLDPNLDVLDLRSYTQDATDALLSIDGRFFSAKTCDNSNERASVHFEVRQIYDNILIYETQPNSTSQSEPDILLVTIVDTNIEELTLDNFVF